MLLGRWTKKTFRPRSGGDLAAQRRETRQQRRIGIAGGEVEQPGGDGQDGSSGHRRSGGDAGAAAAGTHDQSAPGEDAVRGGDGVGAHAEGLGQATHRGECVARTE